MCFDVERAVSMAESDKGTGAIDDNLNSKALEKKLSRHMKKYGQNRAAGGAIGEDRLLDDMPDPESGLNRLKPHADTHGRPPSTAGTVAVWEPNEDDEQGQLRQSPEASPTQQQQQEQPQQQAQPINNSGGEVSKSHESEQPAEQHPFEPSASTIPDPRLRLALGGGVGPGPSQGQETIPPSSSTVEPYTSARSTTPSLPVSPGGSSARGSSRGTEREHLQHRRGIAQDEDMAAPGHGVNSSDIEQAASAWGGAASHDRQQRCLERRDGSDRSAAVAQEEPQGHEAWGLCWQAALEWCWWSHHPAGGAATRAAWICLRRCLLLQTTRALRRSGC